MNKRLVIIDPGHGGVDPGAVDGGLQEKTLTLQIAARAIPFLQGQGIDVVSTRTADRYVSLRERTLIERAAIGVPSALSAFVSIHVNAGPPGSRARGLSVFYHETSERGRDLASALFDSLRSRAGDMPAYNAGILVDEGDGILNDESFIPHALYVLSHTASPAALIEAGFITNPADRALLSDSRFQDIIASAIAEGVQAWFASST